MVARLRPGPRAARVAEPDETLSPEEFDRRYPWSRPDGQWPGAATLDELFRTPTGFERVPLDEGSFGHFLRSLPVRLDRREVRAHDGAPLDTPSAGVLLLPLGDRNLQQCADTVLRLRGEYLWSTEQRSAIAFHFTSGDRSAWSDWVDGERFRIDGSRVDRIDGPPRAATRATFRGYLAHLFTYAGTKSLHLDARRVPAGEPTRPGDLFLDPGSPGHVVVVLDVATDAERRAALLGQGFMPAQELHAIRGDGPRVLDGVWFLLPAEPGDELDTPSWEPFRRADRWRFPAPDGAR